MGVPVRLSPEEYNAYREFYRPFKEHLLDKGFHSIGEGSFRVTYQRKNIVIKVPLNRDGVEDNMAEARGWHKYHNQPTKRGLFLAPCRLLPNNSLMMVHVKRVSYESAPDWAKSIDSHQAGTYKGRIVAYDYGLELLERDEWEKEWGDDPTSFYRNSYFKKTNDKVRAEK